MNAKKVKVENDDGEIIRIFYTIKDAASYYGIQPEAITYRAKNRFSRDGETFSFVETTLNSGIRAKNRRLKNYSGKFTFDERKHCQVPYRLVRKHVCITPCPFSVSPKPFVGSCRCLDCSYFKERDKDKMIVFCTGHRFLN